MALTDVLSGAISIAISVVRRTADPSGRFWYDLTFSDQFINSESVLNTTPGTLTAVFAEEVVCTESWVTLSLADLADPMSTIGSNEFSSDPEGGTVKLFAVYNLEDPATGDNATIEVNSAANTKHIPAFLASTTDGTAAPNDTGINVGPGATVCFYDPVGMTAAILDASAGDCRIRAGNGAGGSTARVKIVIGIG